jgi:hypothetical protein
MSNDKNKHYNDPAFPRPMEEGMSRLDYTTIQLITAKVAKSGYPDTVNANEVDKAINSAKLILDGLKKVNTEITDAR